MGGAGGSLECLVLLFAAVYSVVSMAPACVAREFWRRTQGLLVRRLFREKQTRYCCSRWHTSGVERFAGVG